MGPAYSIVDLPFGMSSEGWKMPWLGLRAQLPDWTPDCENGKTPVCSSPRCQKPASCGCGEKWKPLRFSCFSHMSKHF